MFSLIPFMGPLVLIVSELLNEEWCFASVIWWIYLNLKLFIQHEASDGRKNFGLPRGRPRVFS